MRNKISKKSLVFQAIGENKTDEQIRELIKSNGMEITNTYLKTLRKESSEQ